MEPDCRMIISVQGTTPLEKMIVFRSHLNIILIYRNRVVPIAIWTNPHVQFLHQPVAILLAITINLLHETTMEPPGRVPVSSDIYQCLMFVSLALAFSTIDYC